MKRIVIIGAGISGLAAAHRLIERRELLREPLSITVLEGTSRAGGVIETVERDGFLIEHGPDAFITEKPQALDLAKRLGLETHLLQTNTKHRRSFIVRNDRLLPIPHGFGLIAPSLIRPFVTSEILSWSGKARMAMDLVVPRGQSNGDSDESLASFVRRRLGREALERVAQPMIGGIYTADPEKLSLRATMPRFLEIERKHRSVIRGLRAEAHTTASGARYDLFMSFDHGMQMLTDALVDRIGSSDRVSIELNSKVESLALSQSSDATPQWTVNAGTAPVVADVLCLAVPSFTAAKLLKDVDVELSSELASITYASTATVNLAYKRNEIPHPLDGFGFVVPFIEKRTLMACTFSSVKFEGRAPAGQVLLRAFVGGALQPELLELDDAELLNRITVDLRDLLGIQQEPMFYEVSRWASSMPQYVVGHLKRVELIEKRVGSLPHLALAGNAYSGVGIPDCIRSGETAADNLLHGLSKIR